ncbi:hypothetical protein JCM16496A_04830 [Bacteroides rodentium JCM 16496]
MQQCLVEDALVGGRLVTIGKVKEVILHFVLPQTTETSSVIGALEVTERGEKAGSGQFNMYLTLFEHPLQQQGYPFRRIGQKPQHPDSLPELPG